jgi:hypothetical protein
VWRPNASSGVALPAIWRLLLGRLSGNIHSRHARFARRAEKASALHKQHRKLDCYLGLHSDLEKRRGDSVSFSHPTKAFARQDCIHNAQGRRGTYLD